MPTQRFNWGGLSTLLLHELDEGEQPSLVVVLCHGYGASGTDLAGLAQQQLMEGQGGGGKVAFVFPAAPLDLAEQGMPGGRAWWHIDLDRLINRRTPELLKQFRHASPPGLNEARTKLLRLLTEAGQHFGVAANRVVLGGFSQGAMLTTDIALRLKNAPAGLCALSGALINQDEWQPLVAERGSLRVFQSHGRHDSILPFPLAVALRDLLAEGGAEVEFFDFEGDHEINLDVLRAWTQFLREIACP